jgi:preprotein translocase subunit SecD
LRQDLRWKVGSIFLAVVIFVLLLGPAGQSLYKTDPLRLGLDLKGGIELLLAPDYRLGADWLTRLGEELTTKARQANLDMKVDFLGILDNNRYEGLMLTFNSASDIQRVQNINLFPATYRMESYGETRNMNLETKIRGKVVELTVNEDARDFPDDALDRSKAIIENRISDQAAGMAEAEIRLDKNGRLNVQLPGLKTLEQAKELITTTGRLTFRIDKRVVIDGKDLQEVSVTYSSTGNSIGWVINFAFKGEGAKQFGKITTENVGKNMGVYLDETELMNPVIKSPIPDGRGIIEMGGKATKEEVTRDALLIKSGALPISLRVIGSNQVAPTLGKEIVNLSIIGGIIGIILVILFMLAFYGLLGCLADVALVIYGILFLGILVVIRGVLTLPGLAGLILSFGMAVDANVIIFERIKDELRGGKRVRAAVDAGFHRAFTAILDSNVTTLIAAAVLLVFGTGPVRGFAVTLSLGVLISMFTALIVTRMLIDWKIERDPDRYAKSFGFKEVEG